MAVTSFHIKEPGLNVLPPGVERYTVNGGGITGIQIFPDDEIEIVNDAVSYTHLTLPTKRIV